MAIFLAKIDRTKKENSEHATLNIKQFMEQVGQQVASIPVEDLRDVILKMASDAPSTTRDNFLSYFESAIVPPNPVDADEYLLDDIDDLEEKAKSNMLCVGFGWDPEFEDERDYGDESWAEDVDDFLSRARKMGACGHHDLARQAYDAIFDILDLAQDGGCLPGPPDPLDLLETNLDEARALYLREVYLASPGPERPAALIRAFRRNEYGIGKECNVNRMRDASEDVLPEFGQFLNDWIALLEQPDQDELPGYSWKQGKQYLLREAVTLKSGSAGIAELARNRGGNQPRAFIDWIEQLAANDDIEGVIAAATEGLVAIPIDIMERATVGEQLAKAGKASGNLELQLAGRKAAFESGPSIARLASLLGIAAQLGVRDQEINTTIIRLRDLLNQEPSKKDNEHWEDIMDHARGLPVLLCQTLFLGGLYDDAFDFLKKEQVERSMVHGDVILSGISFILRMLARGGVNGDDTPNLNGLWHDALGYSRWSVDSPSKTKSEIENEFEFALRSSPLAPGLENDLLEWYVKAISTRAENILINKNRLHYAEVATMLCSLVETLNNRAQLSRASAIFNGYRKKYAHYRTFIQKLNHVASKMRV